MIEKKVFKVFLGIILALLLVFSFGPIFESAKAEMFLNYRPSRVFLKLLDRLSRDSIFWLPSRVKPVVISPFNNSFVNSLPTTASTSVQLYLQLPFLLWFSTWSLNLSFIYYLFFTWKLFTVRRVNWCRLECNVDSVFGKHLTYRVLERYSKFRFLLLS